METLSNENDAQRSFRSPPRRRRSTFFEKRDSLVPQATAEEKELNICKDAMLTENEEHNQHLARYYEKLLKEKNEWKAEVNDRRNEYHNLKQQYELAAKASSGSRISYSALSSEDIEFLKGKVNISQIVEGQKKLHQRLKETQALYRRAMELEDVLLSHCDKKINEVTDYILTNSTADIKD